MKIDRQAKKEAMKKRHKMCRFEFLEPKNKNDNTINQPQTRVGKPFAVVAARWKWVSTAIDASKKDRQLCRLLSSAIEDEDG